MDRIRLLVTGGSGFIGSNFLDEAERRGRFDLLNVDIKPARPGAAATRFQHCDIQDGQGVMRAFTEFRPQQVVHFAARTDMDGVTVDDYSVNYLGTENVVRAIQKTPSIQRVVFTSSQYVVGPGDLPGGDLDYRPHTIYGESKVRTEKVIRAAELDCSWTMIRPTNIWGKRHPRYPGEFWKVLKAGRYLHPGGRPVLRCYGYVGTVVDQIFSILDRADDGLNGKTFYVGDPPIDIYEWTNAFSLELTGKSVRVVPRPVLRALALMGDLVIKSGGKAPIFTSRYRSMTEDYVTPMDATYAALGPPRATMAENVRETVGWLRSQSDFWK